MYLYFISASSFIILLEFQMIETALSNPIALWS